MATSTVSDGKSGTVDRCSRWGKIDSNGASCVLVGDEPHFCPPRVLEELRTRGVLRSENNPTGDLAEYLFCAAYGWNRHPNSKKAVDATGEDGKRYQIKGRRLAGRNPSRQLSAIRDLARDGFDVLAAVLFDGVCGIVRAAFIPVDVVRGRSIDIDHTNSHRFMLQDNVWDAPAVIDATARLRAIL